MASIAVTAPTNGSRVRGTVEVRVRVEGGDDVRDVTVVIGDPAFGSRPARSAGDGEYVYRWDTTRKLADPDVPAPGDALFWITATAVVDAVRVTASHVPVVTANERAPAGPVAGGWRPELAWAADYGGSTGRWRDSCSEVVGGRYAEVREDPVLGSARRAVRVSVPDSAQDDDEQPTSGTVRFQAGSERTIREGDEFCVGFAFLPPPDFPTVHPRGDVTSPRGTDEATGYIAIFQIYGPPYEQGAPFVLHAERRSVDDPLDEFTVRGNELNPGDPVPFLSLPYRRGSWTDVVFRIRASASIERGWVETYVNQGESTAVRLLPLADGRARLPRVLLRADSEAFRTDMQVYRVEDRFERVTMWHTGHVVARTVEEADPRSYRDGAVW